MTTKPTERVDRSARLMWVKLNDLKPHPVVQRDHLDTGRVATIAGIFDPDKFDAPKILRRDGTDWIIDGWHRVEAAIAALGGDQSVQAWVRHDLTDAEAADWSLGLNDYRMWNILDRFHVAITAGHEMETDIDRVVRSCGLVVSRDGVGGAIRAVGTLKRVYKRSGPGVLARTLCIVRDVYGDAGFHAPIIDGVGLVVGRFGSDFSDDDMVRQLSKSHGGASGLISKANHLHKSTGNYKSHCVAAAVVETYNAGLPRTKKLTSWWKEAK